MSCSVCDGFNSRMCPGCGNDDPFRDTDGRFLPRKFDGPMRSIRTEEKIGFKSAEGWIYTDENMWILGYGVAYDRSLGNTHRIASVARRAEEVHRVTLNYPALAWSGGVVTITFGIPKGCRKEREIGRTFLSWQEVLEGVKA